VSLVSDVTVNTMSSLAVPGIMGGRDSVDPSAPFPIVGAWPVGPPVAMGLGRGAGVW
jgi:hypothetical protein